MVGHHALGIARRARGVAERDRVPFVFRTSCNEAGIAQRQRVLIFDFADPLAARESRIVDIDDDRFWTLHQRQRFGDDAGEFGIDQDDPGPAVIELKGDGGRIEPDVERIEHGPRHRHREMHLVHRGDVRQHRRHRVAGADATGGQIGREAPAAGIGLRPRENAAFVNGADMVGIDGGATSQKTQRRQRHVVGGRLVQSDIVLVLFPTHRPPPI